MESLFPEIIKCERYSKTNTIFFFTLCVQSVAEKVVYFMSDSLENPYIARRPAVHSFRLGHQIETKTMKERKGRKIWRRKKHINNTNRYGMPHQANCSTHTHTLSHKFFLSFAQSFAHHITPLILCFAYRRRNIVLLSCCLHFHSLRLKSHKLWLHQHTVESTNRPTFRWNWKVRTHTHNQRRKRPNHRFSSHAAQSV